ncbi:MAG TPA: TetR/AcrR family transcriptional regulator C-terminal domain-containing protein [Ureibacillus sp.]|nr:TetR/AcrR family transcriptional regulator C-terminal domain-containing protein [Ureibacillus sp.]
MDKTTKQNLSYALIKLMDNYEVENIQIEMLVKEANCTHATFNNQYDSVIELLYEIIDETLEEVKSKIRVPYLNMKEIDFAKFPKKEVILFDYLKEHQVLFDVLMKQRKLLDLNRFFADIIEELYVEEYQFHLNNTKVNPDMYKVYAANGIAAIIIRWMETGYNETPEYLVDQAIELLRTASLGFEQIN